MSRGAESPGNRLDKGKGRARSPRPTESTPLLVSGSGSYASGVDPESPQPTRRFCSRLLSVFLVSLSLCVFALLLLIVVIYTYRSRAVSASPDDILQHALVVRGPDRVDVLNTTADGGIWMRIHGRVGLDAGHVARVNTADGDGIVEDVWKAIGRWGIRRLDRVSVNLSNITVVPEDDPSSPLTTITLPPLELPLTANPPAGQNWLTPVAIPVLIRPTTDVKTLLRFVRQSWKEGTIRVRASVEQVDVLGGGLHDGGWRRRVQISHSDIETVVHISSKFHLPSPSYTHSKRHSSSTTRVATSWGRPPRCFSFRLPRFVSHQVFCQHPHNYRQRDPHQPSRDVPQCHSSISPVRRLSSS